MRRSATILYAVIGSVVSIAGASLAAPAPLPTLADLPRPAQGAIAAAIGHAQPVYHAQQGGAGLSFNNPRYAFTATLTPQGLILTQGGVTATLQLIGWGYGAPAQPLPPTAPQALANRVEYRRGALTEWYINGPLGLEHRITVNTPLPHSTGPLHLAFAIGGDVTPRMETHAAVMFLTRTGAPVLHYAGLTVTDATGATLPAWLTTEGSRLLIQVDDARARYPVTIDPVLQPAMLPAAHGAADPFGLAVALDGDTMVVGTARAISGGIIVSGAAYVFVKPVTGWVSMTQIATLTAADGAEFDRFGISVAISGDTVVVGADSATIGSHAGQGAAYVFVKPVTGWVSMTQIATLTAADGAEFDRFGISVAISGDTIVVGAGGADIGSHTNQGAAYVFTGASRVWTQQAKLTAADGAAFDFFGCTVAISGDTVVVGADSATIGSHAGQGAAYVFVKPVTGWAGRPRPFTETVKLTNPPMGEAGNAFGASVAVSGDTMVTRADSAAIGVNADQGTAYVFGTPRSFAVTKVGSSTSSPR